MVVVTGAVVVVEGLVVVVEGATVVVLGAVVVVVEEVVVVEDGEVVVVVVLGARLAPAGGAVARPTRKSSTTDRPVSHNRTAFVHRCQTKGIPTFRRLEPHRPAPGPSFPS